MSSPSRSDNRPRILIVDGHKLRQAGFMHLLEAWADVAGLALSALLPETPLKARMNAHCKMVIFSLGSCSVEEPQQRAVIKNIRTLLPDAALVILSDRDDSEEVCAAFKEGAAGFMPTSTDPSVAFQALSFIKGGGSFFPPSALSHTSFVAAAPRMRSAGPAASQLSSKQRAVLDLLRQGETNKTIARRLGMSDGTVKVHVRCTMRKFGVANRTQLAIAAMDDCDYGREANVTKRDEPGKG